MSNTGRRLRESNEEILKYIQQLRDQRNELGFLVEKQKTERANLEADMARISYKLGLINKSLSQRTRALKLYDATILEIEAKYKGLADSTQGLLTHVRNESSNLENSIDKRIGTEKECIECPRCETTPQTQNVIQIGQRKSVGRSDEIPTKHIGETGRRRFGSRAPSHTDSRIFNDNPIYSRAMEYPMVLSPMIEKDQMEQSKEKKNGSKINLNMSETPSKTENDNETEQIETVLTPVSLSVASAPQQKDQEQEMNNSTSGTGNFIDGDYSDNVPIKETPPDKSVPSPIEASITSKDITSESPAVSSVEYSRTTTPTDAEEKDKHGIDEYDEVLEDGGSGTKKKKSTTSSMGKHSSSVDTFGQAYKTQHELRDNPPSLQRHKKSIFNRRDQSLFTEE